MSSLTSKSAAASVWWIAVLIVRPGFDVELETDYVNIAFLQSNRVYAELQLLTACNVFSY